MLCMRVCTHGVHSCMHAQLSGRDIHKHIKYLGEALELHTRCKETVSSSRALEQSRALSDVLYELKLAEPLSELGSGSRIASRDQRALQLPNGAVVEFPPPFDTYVESAAPQYPAHPARWHPAHPKP